MYRYGVPFYGSVYHDVYLTHVFSEWIVLEAELHPTRLLHFLLWREAGQLGARTEKLQPNKKFKNNKKNLFIAAADPNEVQNSAILTLRI